MGDYIDNPHGPGRGQLILPHQSRINSSSYGSGGGGGVIDHSTSSNGSGGGGGNSISFPLLTALLGEIEAMNQSNGDGGRTGKPRGRRAGARVPCDDCINRASRGDDGVTTTLQLCENCTAALSRPRGKLAGRRASQSQDEARPARRSRKSSKSEAVDYSVRPIQGADAIDIPWTDDRQEHRALQFFVSTSAPQLAGYFDSPFWQRMVLQAARNEPAVRHAVAGIGALHEKILNGPSSLDSSEDNRTRFALEQCNKSIQHLVQEPAEGKKADLRLMLTTCVLFTCFEALQGRCEQAIIHATQGYNLLQQYAMDPDNKRWDIGAFAVELDQLRLLMRRLQTQSKGLMGKDFNVVPDAQPLSAQRPEVFNSLHEARAGLELVLNQLTVFFLDMELDDQFYDLAVSTAEKHLLFSPWLSSWEEAFTTFLTNNQLNANDRKAAMVLKAHQIVAEILTDVDLSLGEMGWDAFNDKFSAIVDLASAVLEGERPTDPSAPETRRNSTNSVSVSAPTAILSFSLGIVDPLFEVCSRCRDPTLRRQALELLARHPRQECVWSSWSAWKLGKFLMRVEEEGATGDVNGGLDFNSESSKPAKSSDIPLDKRVSESWLDFSDKTAESPGSGRVGYRKAVPRARARYALNPGLFENWATNENDEGFGEEEDVASSATPGSVPENELGGWWMNEATPATFTSSSTAETPSWDDLSEVITG